MIISGMKKCSHCKENLPIQSFFRIKSRGDGFSYSCRQCRKIIHRNYIEKNRSKAYEYNKIWRDKNSERIRSLRMKRYYETRDHKLLKMKEYYQKLKSLIFDSYGHKCACCGESKREFLCIDHIHGGGNKDRKASHPKAVYIRIKKEGFPKDKYRLLCHNCNMSLGFYGYCPHNPKPEIIKSNSGRPKRP